MNDERSADDRARALQDLSALADGEAEVARVAEVCERWRADAHLRASWHAYHLIGDAMRSDELAADCARDAAFVVALRERLAREPVILAPAKAPDREDAAPVRRSAGWSWKAPAAVAAGFVAVAAAVLVTNGSLTSPGGGQGTLAQAVRGTPAPGSALVQVAAPGATEPQLLVADGQLVRDARLQRYLAAHNQFGGSSALGTPSGFLRAATTQTPAR